MGSSNSGNWNSGNLNSGDLNSGDGNSGNRNSGDGNSGNWNSGNWNSGDGNSGNWNSGNRNSGDGNSGNRNSGNWNSGDENSGNRNSGNGNSGNRNSGNGNSGYGNSGNRNSGIFCTTEPTVILFDKQSNKKWEDIEHPDMSGYLLNEFVGVEEMTEEEKVRFPDYDNVGGCLRTYTYKEMWQRGWAKDTEENKKKFLNLPNFDADKFFEITGIDVRKKEEPTCDGKVVEIEGKKYKLCEVK